MEILLLEILHCLHKVITVVSFVIDNIFIVNITVNRSLELKPYLVVAFVRSIAPLLCGKRCINRRILET